jgi:quercetin dioxygenase-like cupin family protein
VEPGQRTVFHSHQAPVTVYILEGAFTLEIEGRPTVTVKKGEAFVEPINMNITGYNKSATERMTAVIFQASDPDKPWLDLKE